MSQVLSSWGYLPDGWKLSTIKDEMIEITDYVANGSFATLKENVSYKDTEDYAILVRTADYHNNFKGNFVYIDEHAYNFLSKSKLHGDEIIIANVGSVGEVFKCPRLNKKMSLAPNAIMVKLKGNNDFYYYWFKSRIGQHNILNLVSGSAQPKFNKTHFKAMEIPVPPIDTQDKIASILSTFDEKIAINRQICENLEAQAQALFRHWFVDFVPFKNGKFIESEYGTIPEGLQYKRIGEMPHILETGKRPTGGVKGINSGVPSIGAENIKGLGCYDYSKTKFVPKEFAASMKKGKINGYELLIYKDGGKPGYFIPNFAIFGEGYPFNEMCLNEHVFKLDFGNKGYSLFAYFFFKTKQIMSYLNAQGAKAAIPGINSKDIENIPMPSIDNDCVKNYCSEVEDIITQILILSKESSRLISLRDTLLPKLMSGQIKL